MFESTRLDFLLWLKMHHSVKILKTQVIMSKTGVNDTSSHYLLIVSYILQFASLKY